MSCDEIKWVEDFMALMGPIQSKTSELSSKIDKNDSSLEALKKDLEGIYAVLEQSNDLIKSRREFLRLESAS